MSEEILKSIEVTRLRVGMFVHLDLGWRQHPFPFNSFKLKNAEQIEIIQSLGVAEVRYSPRRSDVQPEAAPGLIMPAAPEGPLVVPKAAPKIVVVADPAIQRRREQLAAQQSHLSRCEGQFTAASQKFRLLQQSVRLDPDGAREAANELVGGMAAEIEGDREATIRLLSERVGEEVSQHAVNVTVLSMLLAKSCGLDSRTLRDVAVGALLHDIGKLELPGFLRWGTENLNDSELRAVQKHVEFGVESGRRMGLSPGALRVIAEHHEYADGSGYPQALSGEQISPAGRIVILVNHYDNLCNQGGAVQGMTPHDALALMFAKQRPLFDERSLVQFVRMMGVYPPGTIVELSDGRPALVVSANAGRPLRPRVVVYDRAVAVENAMILDLDVTPNIDVQRSIRPPQVPRDAFAYLAPRKRMSYFFEPANLGMRHGAFATAGPG